MLIQRHRRLQISFATFLNALDLVPPSPPLLVLLLLSLLLLLLLQLHLVFIFAISPSRSLLFFLAFICTSCLIIFFVRSLPLQVPCSANFHQCQPPYKLNRNNFGNTHVQHNSHIRNSHGASETISLSRLLFDLFGMFAVHCMPFYVVFFSFC